jgi:hypothetical protein
MLLGSFSSLPELQPAGAGRGAGPVVLTSHEQAAIAVSKAMARKDFATDEQVDTVWRKHAP